MYFIGSATGAAEWENEMPKIANNLPSSVTIRIKAGSEWRGVKYFEPTLFNLSVSYAKHVVETLQIAEYVDVDHEGNFQD